MADSLARKVAQQRLEIESFDAQVGGPSVVYLQTAIDIAEEYESALAPMREALQATSNALLDAEEQFVGLAAYLATCNTDVIVENLETTITMLHQAEKSAKAAAARAAEVLKGVK